VEHARAADGRERAPAHRLCASDVAVVHNGIVENYEALKAELSDHKFTSDTDTEVIPHLIEEELAADPDADLLAAVQRVEDRLEGSYAICAVREGDDDRIVARCGSPLVLGRSEDASFVASDVTAFLEHTRDVTYLEEDGDGGGLSPDGVEIFADGEPVDRAIETVTWEADAAEKGGYEHYMRKEIHEQPESLRQTLAGRLDVDAGDVDLDVSFPPGFLADGGDPDRRLRDPPTTRVGTPRSCSRTSRGCARPSRSPASTSSARGGRPIGRWWSP